MKLVPSILKNNPCYTMGEKIKVKGLMLHSVGCPQPSAAVFIRSWNTPSFDRACVHAFIDGNDGTIYQTLPWNHRGWHCGGSINGSGNNTHIGVEMCEPDCIAYTGGASFICSDFGKAKKVAERTYKSAVYLFAMICTKFGLDPLRDGVIISHREGHRRGIASNHGDPEHLWNQLGTGYTMDTFRKAVKAAMGSVETKPKQETPMPSVNGFPALPFRVKVLRSDLSYRSEPSFSGKVNGQTGRGVFTIVEVRNEGWGRLKSGVGWIWLKDLSYCKIGQSVPNNKRPIIKSLDEIAKEVIQGLWGNGEERKTKLISAGYDYEKVQDRVNELLG